MEKKQLTYLVNDFITFCEIFEFIFKILILYIHHNRLFQEYSCRIQSGPFLQVVTNLVVTKYTCDQIFYFFD